jgi:hypothetical protein
MLRGQASILLDLHLDNVEGFVGGTKAYIGSSDGHSNFVSPEG